MNSQELRFADELPKEIGGGGLGIGAGANRDIQDEVNFFDSGIGLLYRTKMAEGNSWIWVSLLIMLLVADMASFKIQRMLLSLQNQGVRLRIRIQKDQ